jgi:hypothetical protein
VLAAECIFAELLQGAKDPPECYIIGGSWGYQPKTDGREIWIGAGKLSGVENLAAKGIGLTEWVFIIASRRTATALGTLDKRLQGCLEQL